MAQERLTEPRVTMKRLLAKPRSFSNLPAFLDLNGITFSVNPGFDYFNETCIFCFLKQKKTRKEKYDT